MTKKYSNNPITRNHRKMKAIFDILLRLKKELNANEVERRAKLNNDVRIRERNAFSGMAECLA
tara:strand:- start:3685 stop:3873 length:189 start_codon:yes stop_codon:yes gene_type:complete